MKTLSRVALAVLAAITIASVPDAAAQAGRGREQQRVRDQVCVYQDIHYKGWEQCYNAGDELPRLQNRKDAISSIRIFGRARITIYDGENFAGRSAEFDSNVPDLGLRNLAGSRSWSDRIESFRIEADNTFVGNGRGRGLGRPDFGNARVDEDLRDGICVFEHANYQGRSQCFSPGEQAGDLNREGNLSDRISSIRFFGRSTAVLYRDVQFRGDNITVDQDVPDLAQLRGRGFSSWNDQISSLEIHATRVRFRPTGR